MSRKISNRSAGKMDRTSAGAELAGDDPAAAIQLGFFADLNAKMSSQHGKQKRAHYVRVCGNEQLQLQL